MYYIAIYNSCISYSCQLISVIVTAPPLRNVSFPFSIVEHNSHLSHYHCTQNLSFIYGVQCTIWYNFNEDDEIMLRVV